jgi:hypothetical protein
VRAADFCQWQPQLPGVQRVTRPESGFLCALHVLPVRGQQTLKKAVRAAVASTHERYQRSFNVRAEKIAGHRILRSRFQAGKTRLDHFANAG